MKTRSKNYNKFKKRFTEDSCISRSQLQDSHRSVRLKKLVEEKISDQWSMKQKDIVGY